MTSGPAVSASRQLAAVPLKMHCIAHLTTAQALPDDTKRCRLTAFSMPSHKGLHLHQELAIPEEDSNGLLVHAQYCGSTA